MKKQSYPLEASSLVRFGRKDGSFRKILFIFTSNILVCTCIILRNKKEWQKWSIYLLEYDVSILSGPKDMVFIYFVGLGATQYLTFPSGPGITAQKFTAAIKKLKSDKKAKKVMEFWTWFL